MKTCRGCRKSLDESEFSVCRRNRDGRQTRCRSCQRKYQSEHKEAYRLASSAWRHGHAEQRQAHVRKWNEGHPESWRAAHYRRYGLTIDQVETMRDAQQGLCKICQRPEYRRGAGGRVKRLSVDHCHETKRVRGLLCHDCNTAIGLLQHSTEMLRRAAMYLEQST
jgi:Recombination endonuclease VII